jgi:hypothetical protein
MTRSLAPPLLVSRSLDNLRERLESYQCTLHALRDEATPDHLRELLRQPVQAYQEALRQGLLRA